MATERNDYVPDLEYTARTVGLNVGGCIAVERNMDKVFPFANYRPLQEKALGNLLTAVNDPDVDVVVLDAPTGVGKSALNVAACRDVESAFYTTPQKKLRQQLANDAVLSDHFTDLKSRRDYTCQATGDNCQECEIYQNAKYSCASDGGDDCTYWQNKLVAMSADTAVITFAYLIVDTMLGEGDHAFGDRDVLVVDECQSLENQAANLFAGFAVSPHVLPEFLFAGETRNLDMNVSHHTEVTDIVDKLYAACEVLVDKADAKAAKHDNPYPFQFRGAGVHEGDVDDAKNFMAKVEWFRHETQDEDRDWVVETDMTYDSNGNEVPKFDLIPVKVDRFLENFVWDRADTIVLSTATVPFRGNIKNWLHRIGLGDEVDAGRAQLVRTQMPFPKENRPIHTDEMVCKMSGGGDKDNWEKIMQKLDELAGRHNSQNGLIHTASFARAKRIVEHAKKKKYQNLYRNIHMHEPGDNADETITEWLGSSENILLSPSMMEGVSLANDKCRWQVLLKVPYPNINDNRVSWILDETDDGWNWYNETAGNKVVQAAGRAVRHPNDTADFYVLDTAFKQLRRKVQYPYWYNESIGIEEIASGQNSSLEW